MKQTRHSLMALSALASVAGLSGCADTRAARAPSVRPAALSGDPTTPRDEGYYHDAVAAIGRRDYATALDLLQAARERRADDVRVLNAFGVVYDKLGRFDLSARYYTQALALAPDSPVVRNNLAYSAKLQGKSIAPATALALAPPKAPPAALPAPAASADVALSTASEAPQAAPVTVSLNVSQVNLQADHDLAPKALSREVLAFQALPSGPDQAGNVEPAQTARSEALAPLNVSVASLQTEPDPPQRAPVTQAVAFQQPPAGPDQAVNIEPAAPSGRSEPSVSLNLSVAVPQTGHALFMGAPAKEIAALERKPLGLVQQGLDEPATPSRAAPVEPLILSLVNSSTAAAPLVRAPGGAIPIIHLAAAAPYFVAANANPILVLSSANRNSARPLTVIYASGRRSAAESVRFRLAQRGWQAPPSAVIGLLTRASARSTIYYPPARYPTARALARTLPFSVDLAACRDKCRGLRLTLGNNVTGWRRNFRHS